MCYTLSLLPEVGSTSTEAKYESFAAAGLEEEEEEEGGGGALASKDDDAIILDRSSLRSASLSLSLSPPLGRCCCCEE